MDYYAELKGLTLGQIGEKIEANIDAKINARAAAQEPSDLDRLRLIAELLRAMTEDLTSVVDRLDERDERREIELTETWA